ncbi:MAG: hypothetical protein N2A42_11620 [Luteolibacter sp.]
MKILSAMRLPALLLALFGSPVVAEDLTHSDREALLERLEIIRKESATNIDARFLTAISAFRGAMTSGAAAMDLYLKCEEMVNFEEMQKKNVDFREWKRKNTDKLSDKGFREALRQQLRWLVLTLEAASEDADRDRLAVEAGKVLDSIVSDAEDYSEYRAVLQQGVTSSVFARAYDVNGVTVENWALSPVPVAAIYEQVILPQLRRPDRLASLQSAWAKRMVQESTLLDAWSGRPGGKRKSGTRSPAYEKFISQTLPKLQWESEVDLFSNGDEQAAALRMVDHIKRNMSHDAAPKWIDDFTALIQGNIEAGTETP